MATSESESRLHRIGAAVDAWTPRVLKVLGLIGFGAAITTPMLGGAFDPTMFGGSLIAASGGYVGDALNALKSDKG